MKYVCVPVENLGPHFTTGRKRRAHDINHGVEMNDITKPKVQHDEGDNHWCLDTVTNTDDKNKEIIRKLYKGIKQSVIMCVVCVNIF